MRFIFWWW